ncbi:hypothetical protein PY092_10805 [Muricauda sp. 334s03]|jgi:hypothetical protein|uniref:Uncharacterized protein n=1 Tax=Flagellimonas yonaguniensis TaxID=3031325 RepID=A0ABT5XZV9_9FLAO|nr:hypothetical protein [[Muricauda] yonaguniensis]MDF0716639.1 hypothetical protein [[Muricauda] yonaguniensis]
MKTLEYHETILKKVSFDKRLLKMELKKAVRNTTCSEQPVLLEWCGEHLGEEYKKMAAVFMKNKSCAFEESDS